MEGKLNIDCNKIEAILDDGRIIPINVGEKFEVLVFSALLRFEWITVQLAANENGYYLKAPASRPIVLSKVSKIRLEV